MSQPRHAAPLLAFDELLRLGESGDPPVPGVAPGGSRLDLTRERLRATVARPEVREAILVASPDLEASLAAWLKDPECERARGAIEAPPRTRKETTWPA